MKRTLAMLVFLVVAIYGGTVMAQEGEGGYLSNKETIDKIYDWLQSNQLDSATAYLKSLGEDQAVAQTWVNVQCDINNIKHDPETSAEIGQAGVDFMMEKGFKIGAAIMLHNISAFFMPNFDENVDPEAIPTIISAARKQVPLRKKIGQPGPLMWSFWDLGVAELAAGDADKAIKALEEGVKVASEQNDNNGAAWCNIFVGKAMVKYLPDQESEGESIMRDAANVIMDTGQDWEKDAINGILQSVGLE